MGEQMKSETTVNPSAQSMLLARGAFFETLKRADPSQSLVVLFSPPARFPQVERESIAAEIEELRCEVPGAVAAGRLAFTSSVVITTHSLPRIVAWWRGTMTRLRRVLLGIANVGTDGLGALELLDMGSHEEALQHPEGRTFALSNGWVSIVAVGTIKKA